MKRILSLLPLLLFCGFVNANTEDFQVNGRITDQEQKPVEFVVVTLLKAADSSLVKGSISDGEGKFSFTNLAAGNYIVSASFTGFTQASQGPFEVGGEQLMNLPDIILAPSKEMTEVEIRAVQPLFVQKPDKLIMNVENSPVRITGTAWDVLSTAPGVVVDQNGKITLRGKAGVLIYVDGKNTFLAGDQLINFLQNISAADVVQIEIISNPSAKYDAQGSGGILNIITKKGSQQGFNGAVRAGYGQAFYSKYEAGMNFNYAKEKFNVYGKFDYANRTGLERFYIDRNIIYNNSTTNFNQHSSTVIHPSTENARLGVDFYGKHNITWGARIDGSLANEKRNSLNSTMISTIGNDTATELLQRNTNEGFFKNGAANLYFQQKYDTNGRELSASVDYIAYNNDDLQNFELNYLNESGSTAAPSEFQRSHTISDIKIGVGQIDYAHPFGKKYKLETGVKSSYVKTGNDLLFDVQNNSVWENDTTKSNEFVYTEVINAAYVTGYADFGKLQFMAGLRAEQTLSDGNSPTTGQHLKNSYVQLFPSIFILHKLSAKHSLNYTYSRRVNRPDYENLNPFVFYLDKYTYEQGNPFLQPEISNNIDITYSFMDALFVTVGGSRTKHAMTDVTNQIDSTGVGFKTTVNLNNVDNLYFGVSTPIPIGSWLMAEVELNEVYNRFNSELYGTMIDNRSWMFNGSLNLTFSLPKEFKIQTWGWYNTPATYGIFKSKSMGGVGGSISKSFLDRQLSVNLVFQDIFQTTGMRATVNFQNQDVYLHFIPESPRVFLRLRYSFGNKKATRKVESKSGADDLKNRTGK